MFCLVDVCRVLEIKNPSQTKTRLNQKGLITNDILTNGGKQETTFVNESNFYKLVFQSRKPIAERFSDWVTGEVLPQIRKTGGYIPINESDSEMEIMSKALIIAQYTLKKKDDLIAMQKPMVAIAENRIDKKGCMSITDITKSLGFKRGQITRWAKAQGYLHLTLTEVNKVGEKYFKVYSSDGIHNQIGVLESGVHMIEEHKEEIVGFKKAN